MKPFEALLVALPKGGELHTHLSGAVRVDELLRIAKQKGDLLAFAHNQTEFCGFANGRLKLDKGFDPKVASAVCQALPFTYKTVAEVELAANAALIDSVHDVLTIEHNEGDDERSAFKQFRRAFGALDALTDNPGNIGDLVASVINDAYRDRVCYLELMLNPIGRKRVAVTPSLCISDGRTSLIDAD